MNLVSSFVICGEARTSSSLYPARNCAYGLLAACLWFFAAMRHDQHTQRCKVEEGGREGLTNLSQMFNPSSIHLEILLRGSPKQPRIRRAPICTGRSARRSGHERAYGTRAIRPRVSGGTRPECARSHAFESERERAACLPRADERRGVHERGAARRAVVVHVCDRDAREPELVERGLTARRCSEDVADKGGLDGVIRDPYVRVCGRLCSIWGYGSSAPASRSAFAAASRPICG
jgi:hypothetical protein